METLSRVIRYGVTVTMLILANLGISIAPILGAAGVVGVAIGFGAQSLVKEFFSGFFILRENQVWVGEIVLIAGQGGLAEEVTPSYSFALMDIGVAYREDIEWALHAIRDTGAELRARYGLRRRDGRGTITVLLPPKKHPQSTTRRRPSATPDRPRGWQ